MASCITCNKEKSPENFQSTLRRDRNNKIYTSRICKECKYLTQKEWLKNEDNILYKVWAGMKARCDRKNRPDYPRYGGRGISYCARWADYKNFFLDMGNAYKKGLQLDRINNNGPYSPENCKWSTPREQNNNKRNTRLFSYKGLTYTLADWSKALKVKRSTLAQRFYSYRWPIEKVLSYNITHQ